MVKPPITRLGIAFCTTTISKKRLNKALRLASAKKGFCACTARTVTSATTREKMRRSNVAMTQTRSALSPATISNNSSNTPESAHKGAGSAVLATLLISNCTDIGVARASRLIATV